MKLALDRLDCRGLALSLPRDAPRGEQADPDVVDIARAAHLRGTYEQDAARIRLAGVAAAELELTRACWHLASGRILAPAPVSLGDFTIDAEIGRGKLAHGRPRFVGRIAATRGRLGALRVELPSSTVAGEVELQTAAYKQSAGDGSEVTAGALLVTDLDLDASGLQVDAARVEASDLAVVWGGKVALGVRAGSVVAREVVVATGDVVLRASELRLSGLEVSRAGGWSVAVAAATLVGVVVEAPGSSVRADELRLPAGARLVERALSVAALEGGAIAVELAPRPSTKTTSKRKTSASASALDWSFLDALEGQLAIDLTVDAKVPLIKRRVATHRFRVALEGGTLDYKQLERGLSFLEDAILDFAVRKNSLVLEVDVPLVPFDNRTLVSWALDADGLALAARNRVRLRTLPDYRLPAASGARRKKESALELSRLDFDRIDADLRVGGPARVAFGEATVITLGRADGPGIAELRIDGALFHRPGEARAAELTLEARGVLAAVEALAVGRGALHVARLGLGALTGAAVQFEGLRPRAGRATLQDLDLRDVRLDL